MDHPNMSFFLLFIALITMSNFPQSSVADHNKTHGHHRKNQTNLVETACSQTQHKESCVAALNTDPNARVSDMKGLALIALKLASSNASDASEHLKAMLGDEGLDPVVQDAASECLEYYLDAAEQLDDSVAALLADAHKDVNTWVQVAITDADSCDAALESHADQVMGTKPEAFRRLCTYALAVNDLVHDQAKSV